MKYHIVVLNIVFSVTKVVFNKFLTSENLENKKIMAYFRSI